LLRRLHFDLWYLLRPPWDSRVSPPELVEFIRNHPPGSAIDLGCGSGTNVITLAQHGWQVTGLDYAPRAIRIASRRILDARVQASLRICDVRHTEALSGPFDLALDLGCFHGLEDSSGYLDGLVRLLKPGGFWLLYAFFRAASAWSGPGLDGEVLDVIESRGLLLRSRKDGVDKRNRPSAWLLYQLEPAGMTI